VPVAEISVLISKAELLLLGWGCFALGLAAAYLF
jgi:hypothetical protein